MLLTKEPSLGPLKIFEGMGRWLNRKNAGHRNVRTCVHSPELTVKSWVWWHMLLILVGDGERQVGSWGWLASQRS